MNPVDRARTRSAETEEAESAVLPTYQLRQRLGETTFAVWQALLRRRGRDGFTRATVATVSKVTGLGVENVRRIYKRLGRLGLLEAMGRMKTGLYHHRVIGNTAAGGMSLPAGVLGKLEGAAGWGGRRGCRTPGIEVVLVGEGSGTLDPSEDHVGVCGSSGTLEGGDRSSVPPHPGGQVYPPSVLGLKSESVCTPDPLTSFGNPTSRERRRATPPGGGLPAAPRPDGKQPTATHPPASAPNAPACDPWGEHHPPAPNPSPPPAKPWPRELGSLLGVGFQPGPPPRRVSLADLAGRGLFPPYPTEASIPHPKLPEPPLLPVGGTTEAYVGTLVNLYRTVVWTKMGQKPWGLERFKAGDLTPAKPPKGGKLDADDADHARLLRLLHAGADRMAELEIAPAAWVAWSLEKWLAAVRSKRRPKPPPLRWVFDPERIHERRGWFKREASRYAGGRSLLGPLHKGLLLRYHRLRMAAGMANTDDPKKVRALVREHFPEGWDAAVAAAKSESENIQRLTEEQVKRGMYLWA
jgi:hypothetical protein